jgi:hypothetical protein
VHKLRSAIFVTVGLALAGLGRAVSAAGGAGAGERIVFVTNHLCGGR